MNLRRLIVNNFRCLKSGSFEPKDRISVFVGKNGQGKTSFLEAIGLLTLLRSFRQASNRDMIRWHSEQSAISGLFEYKDLQSTYSVDLVGGRKFVRINDKSCRFLSEYFSEMALVSFSPIDLEIVTGLPQVRRAWIDRLAQIVNVGHVEILSNYRKIITNRNALLQRIKDDGLYRHEGMTGDYSTWTEQAARLGAQIIQNRARAIYKASRSIQSHYESIAGKSSEVDVRYLSAVGVEHNHGQNLEFSLKIIEQSLLSALEGSFQKDLMLGVTTVGPHRDDIAIKINGQTLRNFGSQGEVRSMTLALRLSEVDVYRQERSVEPILLVDDFSSELDEVRQRHLLNYLMSSQSQIFLSTTQKLEVGTVYFVDEGKIH